MAFRISRRSNVSGGKVFTEIIVLVMILFFGQMILDAMGSALGVSNWTAAAEGNTAHADYKFTYQAISLLGLTSDKTGTGFLAVVSLIMVFSIVLKFIKVEF